MSEVFNIERVMDESLRNGNPRDAIRAGIRAAFQHIEEMARRMSHQTADSDAGRGRWTALREISKECERLSK